MQEGGEDSLRAILALEAAVAPGPPLGDLAVVAELVVVLLRLRLPLLPPPEVLEA